MRQTELSSVVLGTKLNLITNNKFIYIVTDIFIQCNCTYYKVMAKGKVCRNIYHMTFNKNEILLKFEMQQAQFRVIKLNKILSNING